MFAIKWLSATFLAFTFMLGTMFYAAWFRYDLIIKWAHEDKWTWPEFYQSVFAKWFLRIMTLLFVIAYFILAIIFIGRGSLNLFEWTK